MDNVAGSSSQSLETASITLDNTIESNDPMSALREKCSKTAYLDGKFFDVDFTKSDPDGSSIVAKCMKCPDNSRLIRGCLKVSSNFVSHLGKHDRAVDEYKDYVKIKRARIDVCRRVTCRFSQEIFEDNVTTYILENMVPLNTVEKSAFRKMFDGNV